MGRECPPRAIKFAAWQRVLQQPGNPQGTPCVRTVAHWPVTGCNLDGAAMKEIRWELSGEADKLEPIRDANLALRNAAEYWQEEAEKLAEI